MAGAVVTPIRKETGANKGYFKPLPVGRWFKPEEIRAYCSPAPQPAVQPQKADT